ncbi:MAG: type II secretion system F family protein [Candidatus Eremiobacteraeota bacterium]|nr:type II secretion system F family protein [Candidatus Eremiobacteraeota bacterium]
MAAGSAEDVIAMLRTRALVVTSVERESTLAQTFGRPLNARGPSRRALLIFLRSFATLARAGVALPHAVAIATERTSDAVLREALRSVRAQIELGEPLSEAMARRPRVFPHLVIAIVRAGEKGGVLDDALEQLTSFLERDAGLRNRLRSALAYPAIVLTAASVLVVFLLARIVPMFAEMFTSFGAQLPLSTRVLLGTAGLLSHAIVWFVGAGIIVAAGVGGMAAVRTRRGSLVLDASRLGIPVLGPLLSRTIVARVTRMLATLLRCGIDLVPAIELVRPVAGSPMYSHALRAVEVSLHQGETLSAALRASRRFDPLAVALVAAGEESGLLDEMLLTVARYFEGDAEAAIATLGAVIEPALIGALGLVVGFIVVAIFIPLYSLIGSVGK